MIVHVVLFRPRADLAPEQREGLVAAFMAALRDIPAVRYARIGQRLTHGRPYEQLMRSDYPWAALLEFDDADSLRQYLDHPAHEQLASRFFDAFEDALIYDYDLQEGASAVPGLRR
jgi:hypothetical protein